MNPELYILVSAIALIAGFAFGKWHERRIKKSERVTQKTEHSFAPAAVYVETKKPRKRKIKTRKPVSEKPKRKYTKRTPVLNQIEEAKAASEKLSGQKVDTVIVGSEVAKQIVKEKKERKPRTPANVATEPVVA